MKKKSIWLTVQIGRGHLWLSKKLNILSIVSGHRARSHKLFFLSICHQKFLTLYCHFHDGKECSCNWKFSHSRGMIGTYFLSSFKKQSAANLHSSFQGHNFFQVVTWAKQYYRYHLSTYIKHIFSKSCNNSTTSSFTFTDFVQSFT